MSTKQKLGGYAVLLGELTFLAAAAWLVPMML